MFKKLLLLTVTALLSLGIPAWGQVRQITIDDETMSVRALLKEVERQSGLSFAYDNSDVNLSAEVRVKANKEDVQSFLNRILASQNLNAQIDGTRIFLKKVPVSQDAHPASTKASRELRGVVKDSSGEPLIGATVQVQGTQIYAITDLDGAFTIKSQQSPYNLIVSLLGYHTQTVACAPNQDQVEVVMQDETSFLDEVVVVGYGS